MTAVAFASTYIALSVEPGDRSIVASDGTTYTVPLASVGPLCVVDRVALVVKPVLAGAAEAKRDSTTARTAGNLRPMVALSLKIGFCLCTISCLHLRHEKVSSSSEFPMPYLILYQNMACPDTRSLHLPHKFCKDFRLQANRVSRE